MSFRRWGEGMISIKRLALTVAATVPFAAISHTGHAFRAWVGVSGIVVDEGGQGIGQAEVSLSALGKATFSDDSGRFRFIDVAAGSYEIRVRRLGYRELAESVAVGDEDLTALRLTLGKVATLSPVEVTADPGMGEFEENRRIGLGKFLTRAELQKQEHRRLADILDQVGARVVRSGTHAWVGNSRGFKASGKCAFVEGREVPQQDLRSTKNPGCGCFAQVYLDDVVLYSGEEGRVVPDINFIAVQSLEGIEFYKGASQTPPKYSRLNSQCGVLVLHTRRTPGVVKQP